MRPTAVFDTHEHNIYIYIDIMYIVYTVYNIHTHIVVHT